MPLNEKMDGFGFGVLGGMFTNESRAEAPPEQAQREDLKYEVPTEYTPPDVPDYQQVQLQKAQKNSALETLLPVVVRQILDNIAEGDQKLKLYNTAVGGLCVVGKVCNIEKVPSGAKFQLADATGTIDVNYTSDYFMPEAAKYVQVVGSLVTLALDTFYIDAQHVLSFGDDEENFNNVIKHHYTKVAYVAFHLDIAAKLMLQDKQVERVTLPGEASAVTLDRIEAVQLPREYDHINDKVQLLVIKYLRSQADSLARRQDIINCLAAGFVESVIEKAIANLESESEIACTKEYVCLAI